MRWAPNRNGESVVGGQMFSITSAHFGAALEWLGMLGERSDKEAGQNPRRTMLYLTSVSKSQFLALVRYTGEHSSWTPSRVPGRS